MSTCVPIHSFLSEQPLTNYHRASNRRPTNVPPMIVPLLATKCLSNAVSEAAAASWSDSSHHCFLRCYCGDYGF
ncbi:hypothetical protein VIGAN_01219900 [Vigna angularis var. angularis]|uniref:Uncharacterized protein n=1 Tax=Vigna angularis var. angularis TaxID=157739 RepID=A0A0S3R220_PHAAN|nr:hypothetical protein VIGAN_01219900 [Vigna angularis var. angularis]